MNFPQKIIPPRCKVSRYTSIVIMLLLLTCMREFDNPLDPQYNGSYSLNVADSTQPSHLEVLKRYSISYKNTGSDLFWKVYLAGPLQIIYHTDTSRNKNDDTISFVFTASYSGKLFLIGERPNGDKDTVILQDSLSVENPYSIMGKNNAGTNESVVLFVAYYGSRMHSKTDTVYWTENDPTAACDSFPVSSKTTKIINATIRSGGYNAVIPPFTITFSGSTPEIDSVRFIDSTIQLGQTTRLSVKCKDSDTDSLRYVLQSDTTTLIDTTLQYDSNFIILTTDTLKDTLFKNLTITVYDSSLHSVSKAFISSLPVKGITPVITIENDTVKPAVGDSEYVYISGKADRYYWIKGTDTITTDSNSFPVIYDTAKIETLTVFAINSYKFPNDTFTYKSNELQIVIIPTKYECEIRMKSAFPTSLKVKTTDTLEVAIIKNDSILSDSDFIYTWLFSDTAGSGLNISYPLSKTSSSCRINCKDSIPSFIVSVKATRISSPVEIKPLSANIKIRTYKPAFAFDHSFDTLTSNLFHAFTYTATDTAGGSGSVVKIYFKEISSDTATQSVNPGDSIKMTFKTAGRKYIEGWAVDNDTIQSKHDTISFTIKIDRPQFKDTLQQITVSIGDTCKLIAALVEPVKNARYHWDLNNDSDYYDSITTDSIYRIIYTAAGNDTINVLCKNELNDSTVKQMTFIISAVKNAPFITIVESDTNINFVNRQLFFNITVTDKDSGLTKVSLFKRISSTDSLMLDTQTPLASQSDSLLITAWGDKPSVSGLFTYFVIAEDKNGNIVKQSIDVTIDKGLPVIDSIKLREDTVFIKKNIIVDIWGHDPDDSIAKVYLFNSSDQLLDSIVSRSKQSVFTDTISFSNAGTYRIKAQAVDSNNFYSSLFTSTDSVIVNQGAPVVSSAVFAKDTGYISAGTLTKNYSITVNATDPDDSVDSVYFYSETDNLLKKSVWNGTTTHIDSLSFTSSGTKRVKVIVFDTNHFASSAVYSDNIILLQGIPGISSVSFKDSLFINDMFSFTIHANDNDKELLKYAISFNDSTGLTTYKLNDSVFTKTFSAASDSGMHTFFVQVRDTNGQVSTILKDTLFVRLGRPVMNPVVTVSPSEASLFVKDSITFTVKVTDTNGTIDSVMVDKNSDGTADQKLTRINDSTFKLICIFARTDAGAKTFSFWALDTDNLKTSTIQKSFTIRKSAPKFDSLSSQTNRWVKDTNTYIFNCNDTNGAVKQLIINWADGTFDTVLNSATTPGKVALAKSHSYPVVDDKTYKIYLTLVDDDSVTTSDSVSVLIKRGMPTVAALSGTDTLFTRISDGGGACTLSVVTTDNDYIARYYWFTGAKANLGFDTNGIYFKGNESTLSSISATSNYVNTIYTYVAVFVKDNDGNIVGDTFELYLDGPPPVPTVVFPISSSPSFAVNDTVAFEWTGTDVLDSIGTSFQISIDPPGTTSWKSITEFISGNLLTVTTVSGVLHFQYKYLPVDGAGSYSWKVESKDRSSSVATSNSDVFYHN